MKPLYTWLLTIAVGVAANQPVRAAEIEGTWTLIAPQLQNKSTRPNETASTPDAKYTVRHESYTLPAVTLTDAHGKQVEFLPFLDAEGPVLVQFVFATCSTICPILSASFSSAQTELNQLSGGKHRLISISIDPEQDTPEQLRNYAQRFKAGDNWHFLTGNPAAVLQILKAFNATYTGNNKMFHKSLTFMRAEPGAAWRRIDGLLSKQELIHEYKQMLGLPD